MVSTMKTIKISIWHRENRAPYHSARVAWAGRRRSSAWHDIIGKRQKVATGVAGGGVSRSGGIISWRRQAA